MKGSGRIALTMLAALGLGACGSTSAANTSQPFKAAWVYVGPTTDHGWTQAHDDGRKVVEQQLGSAVQTTYKENVPEGPQEIGRASCRERVEKAEVAGSCKKKRSE